MFGQNPPAIKGNVRRGFDTGFVVTVISGLATPFVALLQWNGVVTVTWLLSLCFYVILVAVCIFTLLRWESAYGWRPSRRWGIAAGVSVALLAVSSIGVQQQYRREHPRQDQIMPTTALYMDCTMDYLPIHVGPRSMIHLLPLNPTATRKPNWGFSDVSNGGDKEFLWPDKKLLLSAKHNPGTHIYRCDVSNHGTANIMDVAITFKLDFGEVTRDKRDEQEYTVIANPLDAGHNFVFYLVNECPIMVTAQYSDLARAQVVGEVEPRQIKLLKPQRHLLEQVMILFGSNISWLGDQCHQPATSERNPPDEETTEYPPGPGNPLVQTFNGGTCQNGVPDITRQFTLQELMSKTHHTQEQSTWGLGGVLAKCESNQLHSPAILEFPPGVRSSADTQSYPPLVHPPGSPVTTMRLWVRWYATAAGGAVKWVISKGCDPRTIDPKPHEIMVITDPIGKSPLAIHTFAKVVPLGACKPLEEMHLKIERNGDEDTAHATAHLVDFTVEYKQSQ